MSGGNDSGGAGSGTVSLGFVLSRLDQIQTDLRLLRTLDEQREASHQAIAATLSRQMVELTMAIERRLVTLDERIDRIDETLSHFDDRFDRIEALLNKGDDHA